MNKKNLSPRSKLAREIKNALENLERKRAQRELIKAINNVLFPRKKNNSGIPRRVVRDPR
jgi:hypothetical protein